MDSHPPPPNFLVCVCERRAAWLGAPALWGQVGQPHPFACLLMNRHSCLLQVPPRFPHLPPLPSVESDPAHWKDLGDSPPPQKLQLVVAQVNQPKGIALQWNVSRVDPRCAPIESFSLFICLEDVSNGTTSEWKRTSVIKALPLPMACSLSQFPRSVKCYFTMQSKDVHGRHGPFCEVQSISAL